ncbi:MAG: virulence factor [Woeseiaceae bacterium]
MVKKILVYWRDIPAQVIVQRGRRREKVKLSSRFHEAIDRAAMRAGKGSSDAYLSEWRRESSSLDSEDDLRSLAELTANEFETQFSDQCLQDLIRNHGSAGE